MKKTFLLLCALTISSSGWAQTKVLENLVNFKIRNAGAMMDQNNDVDGYYFFYEVDKINKKEREYAISLLDKNLNNVATKKIVEPKRSVLTSSAFNNQATAFFIFDSKNLTYKLIGYDTKANRLKEKVIALDPKMPMSQKAIYKGNLMADPLLPIDNLGFVINLPVFEKRFSGYELTFYPTNGGDEWTYKSENIEKHHHRAIPVATNDKYLVIIDAYHKKPSKINYDTMVFDVNTGEKLFTIPFDLQSPKLITNSFISDTGNIVLLGQYYEPEAKIVKAESLGLFSEIYDSHGKLISENKMSWTDDINKLLPVKKGSKIKNIGYIYFHDIIKTQKGDYYAIGEQFKKTASAGGIVSGIALAALGGGVQASGYTQLTIDDSYIFKFDENFNLQGIDVFDKGKSRIQNLYDFGSPQLNAFQIKALGGFDYIYSQIDKANDRFYANFIDYDRMEGESSKPYFKTIIYDEGELSEDKIALKNRTKNFRVLPGKLGYILLLEYDRKNKEASMHLEKLNIE